MGNLLLIGIGGFVGAIVRFWLSGRVQDFSGSIGFPYGTLAVNLVGCFLLGAISYLIDVRGLFTPEVRSLLVIGLLGAFTTFSTFSMETFSLLSAGETLRAIINVTSSVLLGLVAVWAGRMLLLLIWR
ncbi:MAG: fluoride efflux transporter CrcB [Anaerolineales bacterium]